PALFLGSFEDALAVRIPSVIELALVFVGPRLCDLMGSVDRAARPVHVEGLVWLQGPLPPQPADRIIRKIFAEVIALLWALRRMNLRCVPHQVGLVLGCLARKESIEILE